MDCALVADVLPPWLKVVGEKAAVPVCTVAQLKKLPQDVRVLVRWGVNGGDDRRFNRVINRKQALSLAYNSKMAAYRLRLNGLQPMTRRSTIGRPGLRLYRVEIFDLEPLTVRQLIHDKGYWRLRAPVRTNSRDIQRAVSAAVRALHALGLDAGRADVVLLPASDGILREGVCTVNPSPDWSGPMTRPMVEAIKRLRQFDPAQETEYLLGTDPELVFIHRQTQRLVPASKFLSLRGSVGCDAQTAPGNERVRPLAELRPSPRRDPDGLVQELRRCMLLLAEKVADPALVWRAGSLPYQGYGVGGHVHFSGKRLNGAFLRALDNYLAVPVMLVEPSEEAVLRRRRHGYLGDIRFKSHGGFEYRTLPSWLVSPAISRAVLALAAWVAEDYRHLPADLFLETDLIVAFYEGDKEPFYEFIDRLQEDLYRSPSWERYNRLVEPLFSLIERRATWDSRSDLKHTWQIPLPQRSDQTASPRKAVAPAAAN